MESMEEFFEPRLRCWGYIAYERYISQEEWNQFWEYRLSVEMMNSRKKHQQIQSKNKHSYYLGRAGYIGKEQEMVSVCCNLLLYNYLHLMSKN